MPPRRSRYRYRSRSRARGGLATVAALVATPLLTVALLAGLGALLPRQQGATVTRLFREPPEVLWQLLSDVDNQPTWRRSLTRVERLPDQGGRPAWLEFRGEAAEPVRLAVARAPQQLVTERVPEGAGPADARWVWEVAEVEEGSRLSLTRQVIVDSPLARAIGFVFQAPRREAEQVLADMAVRLASLQRQRTTALNR